MEHNKSLDNLHVKERETAAALKVKKKYKMAQSVQPRAADHMCRRAVYQLPVLSTATAAGKQIFK